MTSEQKIKNTKLRLALRTGELPYTFEDEFEKQYRQIVCAMQVELNEKFKVSKSGSTWNISKA